MPNIELTVGGVKIGFADEDAIRSVFRVLNILPAEEPTVNVPSEALARSQASETGNSKPAIEETGRTTVARPIEIPTNRDDLGPYTFMVMGSIKDKGEITMADIAAKAHLKSSSAAGFVINRLNKDLTRFGYLEGEVFTKGGKPGAKAYAAGPKLSEAYSRITAVMNGPSKEDDELI